MKLKGTEFLWAITGIFLVELMLNMFFKIGFLLYALFVGVVLILMEREGYTNKDERILIFLMIIPITRLAEVFITFDFFWKTLIFYLFIIFLVIYYSVKLQVKSKPFIGNPIYFIGIALIAGAGGIVAKYVFHFEFASLIFLIPIIAYGEEILFRGGIQNLTRESFGPLCILFTSFLYATFSMGLGFQFFIIAFGVSLIISTLYYFTKNLYLAFVLNLIFHVAVFIIYPGIIK
jgi:membrane protease YdiL (CAAX protease family)